MWPHDQFQTRRRGGRASVEPGQYTAEVESVARTVTGAKAKTPGALKIEVAYRLVHRGTATPSGGEDEFAGLPVFDSFTIGSAADPAAELPETWLAESAVGAQRFAEFMGRASVKATGRLDDDCAAAGGKRLVIEVAKEEEPLKKRDENGKEVDNPYAYLDNGERRMRIRVKRMLPAAPSAAQATSRTRICPTCAEPVIGDYGAHMAAHQ
jgi:hypothetical protein